jgi:hypothetical protein
MELIQRKPRRYHVSQDTVEEFEAAIICDHRVHRAEMNRYAEAAIWSVHRAMEKTVSDRPLSFISQISAKLVRQRSHTYFAVLMGLNSAKCVPYFIHPSRKSIYVFDAWPVVHDRILKFVSDWDIAPVFVSSRQVAQILNTRSCSRNFMWVPEGITPQTYRSSDYAAKDIDVLQLGRKFDQYHRNIAPALARAGKTYKFETVKGELIFPTHDSFIEGLGRTRISICFPSSLTHPSRSGNIETMTVRYLQSMVSKCLVVGHAPAEMIDLFGYNPVIEAQVDDDGSQLLDILNNFEQYKSLIEKNYGNVVKDHTWQKRWHDVARILLR